MLSITNILIGAGVGAGFGILGYFKTPGQSFEGWQFIKTAMIGAIAGGTLGMANVQVDFASVENAMVTVTAYGGLTVIIENLSKAVWRRVGTKLTEFLGL